MEKTEKISIDIIGMHCSSCAQNIEKKIRKEGGVKAVSVSYAARKGSVEFDPKKTEGKKFVGIINKMGYKAFFKPIESEGFSTDPVCGMRVSKTNSIKKQFDGRKYYSCKQK